MAYAHVYFAEGLAVTSSAIGSVIFSITARSFLLVHFYPLVAHADK